MRYLCVLLVICTAFNQQPTWRKIQISGKAQGTTYHITWYAQDSTIGQPQIDSILAKIDTSLSIYNPFSLISRFNDSASSVIMDEHMLNVVNKSIDTYRKTGGIFDITVEPLVQAWGFGPKKITGLPDSAAIKAILKCVGPHNLRIQDGKLHKLNPCTKIDVNGIAQGYSVDVVADYLEAHGIRNYLVEIGGEIRVKGHKQPGGEKMKIGIEAPGDNDFELTMINRIVAVDSGAITTSGSYRKFYESEGKKISHLIDPRTGYPSQNELISVTVFARDAITADAYDNALMVMGLKRAMQFIEKRKDLAAHFIYRTSKGSVADTASSRFYKLLNAER
ncbi:thiamine biosynthesis protein ApbE [Niastella koreensis]|uniref:FAD:protein FMN transferase n=2 Tax=Niastella koreensis TaxID=354356 RepID=G8TB25_NIAKG|nr:FAD:protein FMN transferase [Niastella koreensis]AEW01372.1 ApbE family lipoprotein [Niastella koreensis GR20-10]OQP46300.1 thiamine biosynthesis protein ApbE [Niastella koreensis]